MVELLSGERMIDMLEYDMKLSPIEAKYFTDYALKNIKKDENYLISWAINDILKNIVELLDNKKERNETCKNQQQET